MGEVRVLYAMFVHTEALSSVFLPSFSFFFRPADGLERCVHELKSQTL